MRHQTIALQSYNKCMDLFKDLQRVFRDHVRLCNGRDVIVGLVFVSHLEFEGEQTDRRIEN